MATIPASKFRHLLSKPKPNIDAVKRASAQSGNAVTSAVNSQRGPALVSPVSSQPLSANSATKENGNTQVNDPPTPSPVSPVTVAPVTEDTATEPAVEDAVKLVNTPPGPVPAAASPRKPTVPSTGTNSSPNKENVEDSPRHVSFNVPPTPSQPANQRERNVSGRGTATKEKCKSTKQRYKKGNAPPERSKMTMLDLIYWNPESNPMKEDSSDELNSTTTEDCQRLEEEAVDDPECNEENSDKTSSVMDDVVDEESTPAPQVKIGPDGTLIIDEQSLVVQTSAAKKGFVTVAVNESCLDVNYNSFRKRKLSRTWTDRETSKFYMALSIVGTDFSMMQNLFPKRERHELKLKYKREEKYNKDLVDKAIHDQQQYDLSIFEEDNSENENPEETKKTTKRKRASAGDGEPKKKRNVTRSRKRKVRLQDESDTENEDNPIDNDLVAPTDQNNTHEEILNNFEIAETLHELTPMVPEAEDEIVGGNSTEEEIVTLDNVLKKTRSGRQPKKRVPYTADEAVQKRRKKLGEDTQQENLISHEVVTISNRDDDFTIEERLAVIHGEVEVLSFEISTADSTECEHL